jgi:hypothetical protein
MFLFYGVAGLTGILLFYFNLLKGLFVVKFADEDNKYMATAFIASITAYLVNSFFHNNGPFLEDPQSWFFIGLAFALLNSSNLSKIIKRM